MPEVDFQTAIRLLSAAAIPVLFAIALHEAAHGWVALRCGDRTAELLGRVTINPLKHIDPVGTILVPLVLGLLIGMPFGWAKPVPVNARNMRNPRQNMVTVAAAGPTANLLMALGWALFLAILMAIGPALGDARPFFMLMAQFGIQFNVLLAIFNLIPIPPLDGGRVLRGLLPERLGQRLDGVERYGLILVMGLLAVGILGRLLAPLVAGVTDFILSLVGI